MKHMLRHSYIVFICVCLILSHSLRQFRA